MYSGTTLKPLKRFDAWFGAHQKVDRIARQHLEVLLPEAGHTFPKSQQILRFEGMDGPDGLKRKNPGEDEPWHFYNPANPHDKRILTDIKNHYDLLVAAIREANQARCAFEGAWLAHTLVDGLTPAHHYPYEQELIKLRGGEGRETRVSNKEKVLMPGETFSKRVGNNWKMWGDKGLLATHFAFEWGVAVMIMPLRLGRAYPSPADATFVREHGIIELFERRAHEIAELRMYEQFYKSGWTPKLARQVRRELMPAIVSTVTLAWYAAISETAGV